MNKSKEQELENRMHCLHIKEDDCIEKFILGSGSGGQKINKTSSCVYLKHIPSGIEIKCQKNRSRKLNRLYARRKLCEKIEEILLQEKSIKRMAIEKIRKQKRRRSKRAQEKMLAQKRHRSTTKQLRKPEADSYTAHH